MQKQQKLQHASRHNAASKTFFAIALALVVLLCVMFAKQSLRIASERLQDPLAAQAKLIAWGECQSRRRKAKTHFSIETTYQYQSAPASALYETAHKIYFDYNKGSSDRGSCVDTFLSQVDAHRLIDVVYERSNPSVHRQLPLEPYVQGIDWLMALWPAVFAYFGYKCLYDYPRAKWVRKQDKRRKKAK